MLVDHAGTLQSDAARLRADGGARQGEALAAGSSHRRDENAIICA